MFEKEAEDFELKKRSNFSGFCESLNINELSTMVRESESVQETRNPKDLTFFQLKIFFFKHQTCLFLAFHRDSPAASFYLYRFKVRTYMSVNLVNINAMCTYMHVRER